MLNRLPLRSRLFLALATVALLPVLVFGVVAVERSSAAADQQQRFALIDLAGLAAGDVPQESLAEANAVSRLAAITGLGVTVFTPDGRVRAQAGSGAITTPPPGWVRGNERTTLRVGDTLVAIVPLQASALEPAGYLALAQLVTGPPDVGAVLAVALTLTVLWAVFLSFALARALVRPLGDLAATLERLGSGDLSARLDAPLDDELGRLARSQNRLASALAARNASLHEVLSAIAELSPRDGLGPLVAAAERAARTAFGFTSVEIVLERDAVHAPDEEERIPGEAHAEIAILRAGDDDVGWIRGVVPPMRDWAPPDADLLALFARQLAVAVRNAELYEETRSLSELKSEFLRGVSHNLQTPLTSIRAFAERLERGSSDPALRIIVEQTDRLSRLVAQLLTVSRLEAGTLRPREEVLALGPLVRRAWEGLARDEVPFELVDEAHGWLAVADRDWVDQVVWALLDNAVKHGAGAPVVVTIGAGARSPVPHAGGAATAAVASQGAARASDATAHAPAGAGGGAEVEPAGLFASGTPARCLVIRVRDHGPGISREMRDRIFERFATGSSGGTGLGLNVAQGLVHAMGGSIWVEEPEDGAAFAFSVPAEAPEES